MYKIAFPLLFLTFLGVCTPIFAQDQTRTGAAATWQVQKYDIDVNVAGENVRTITVKAALALKNVSSQAASTLTLRITPSAEISRITINDSVVDFSKSQESIGSIGTLQRAAIRMPSTTPGALVNARVEYKLKLSENTGLSSISSSSSSFLPLSYWYPTPNSWYFPKGPDVAPVRITVISPGQTVVSSGTETAGVFELKLYSQPFFLAGDWDVKSENGVQVFAPKGLSPDAQKRGSELAALFLEAKAFMSTLLGPAPDTALRIVSSRRGAGFASGGTLVIEEAVFRRGRVDSLTAMNVAEAAAKLWIGNVVMVNGDGFGVISEGLTRYFATQFIEHKFGKEIADVERSRQRNTYAAVAKRDAPMTVVSPLDDYFYPVVSNKGAMAWRLLVGRTGANEFGRILRARMGDGSLTLPELRSELVAHKEIVDYLFDQVTDMNLQVGLPQVSPSETISALRNTGSIDAQVDIVATTSTGEKLRTSTMIGAKKFGEVSFKTSARIVRIEVDSENLYPQTDYSDDIQPRESTDSDPVLAAKRAFDKQDFAGAEATARMLLRDNPHLDDLRIILGRALLAQNKNADAEKEFKVVLQEKLPSARNLAWANVGLAEVASRANQRDIAFRFIDTVLAADAEYGASLAARNLRNRLGGGPPADADIKAFFAAFDKAASSNRKAEVDALVQPGEVARFAGGVSGSTESWQTTVRHVDHIDAKTALVEADMAIKLLNKETETGLAVYRLVRWGAGWKLAGVEMFEVR